MEKLRNKYSEIYFYHFLKIITVDEMGVDKLGVDKMGIHKMGIDKMGSRRSGNKC